MTGRRFLRRPLAVGLTLVLAGSWASPAAAATATGPSTVTAPYVLPSKAIVDITSLLTVADRRAAGNGYEMVGIPDGLGVMGGPNGATLFMNHELENPEGIVRRHGERGSFVSQLRINPNNLAVTAGSDLIDPDIAYWNYPGRQYSAQPSPGGTTPDGRVFPPQLASFGRFCSGDLTDPGQLFNAGTGRGTAKQIYFANEEVGDEGRAFAVETNGHATQLPRLGLFSWENTLAAPNTTDTTVVMGNEDANPGQLWIYRGTKMSRGTAVAQAGLTNGVNSVLRLGNATINTDAEFRSAFGKNNPQPFRPSEVDWNQSGASQNAEAEADGLSFNRIEDGEFDPRNKNVYYFNTTEGGRGATDDRDGGGLWRMRFYDVERPEIGGELTLLLDGSEAPFLNKPDNMTIDRDGNLLIQEDPGGNDHLARIIAYRIGDGRRGVLATFDPAMFRPGGRNFLTNDEESSGIVDASGQFGPGSFLFDAQVHTAEGLPPGTGPDTVQEYVERGQLLLMRVRSFANVYTIG